MYKIVLALTTAVLLLLLGLGCSGGNSVTPDTPGGEGLVSEAADSIVSGSAFMGLYEVNIDADGTSGSIVPIRSNAAVDVLEAVDITGFLTSNPCKDCVKIFNIGFDEEWNLELGIGIKHPFEPGDPAEPITGRNRADIHVFNVEGIVVSDSPELVRIDDLNLDIASANLANPDGYTKYLDNMIDNIVPTQSDIHPYILHFDDYSTGNFSGTNQNGFADIYNPTGNLVMKMGSDYSIKDYVFNLSAGEPLNFYFAVGCTYGFSTYTFLDRFNPEFRVPQFNKKAASEVHVEVISNNLQSGDPASSATLRIEVMDINHGVPTGDGLDEMLFASNVNQLAVYAPEVCAEQIIDTPPAQSGDGRNTPLVYEVTIQNGRNARSGATPVLVKIKDSYPIRSNPNPGLILADIMGRNDDGKSELGYILDMSTYAYVELQVEPCDPVALRSNPVDLGIDSEGNVYIAYQDKSVWTYDLDYCTGEELFLVNYDVAGELQRIDTAPNGNCITISKPTNC